MYTMGEIMVNKNEDGYAGEYALVVKPNIDNQLMHLSRNGARLYRKVSGNGPVHVYVNDIDASVEVPVGVALDPGWRVAEVDEAVTRPRVTLYLNNWPPQRSGLMEVDA
jgi:hypothetical protein